MMTDKRTREQIQRELDGVEKEVEYFEPWMDDHDFMDYLDETHEPIELFGMTYDAGRALKDLDPIAFRCAKADHLSTLDESDFEQYDEYNELVERRDELQAELDELEDEIEDDD